MYQKRIGILTLHKAQNYGAILQAYALVNYLQSADYKAEIIDFSPGRQSVTLSKFVKPNRLGAVKKDILSLINLQYLQKREKDFNTFSNKYLCLSHERDIKSEELSAIAQKYDAVVCGSDQIWNPRLAGSDIGFFLPEGEGFRRIAYAASLGKGYLTEHKHPEKIRKALLNYNSIAVREKTTKDRLQDFCTYPKNIEIVVDPTILVGKEPFYNLAGKKQVNEKYVFLYSVNLRQNTCDAAELISKRTGLPVYTMLSGPVNNRWLKMNKHIAPGDVGPEGFLAMLRDAEFVVTDSFHGTVFSLLFHKRFFVVCDVTNSGELIWDERIGFLCDTFNIGDRLIKAEDIVNISLDNEPHWEEVDRIREEQARHSINYLENAINGVDDKNESVVRPEFEICAPDECSGCLACVNKCAFNALELKTENDGRIRPVINEDKCQKCNACRKVCPIMNPPVSHSAKACYAAQRKDETERIKSASGGISALIAEHVLAKGGVVFGAAIDSDLAVKHICVENVSDIDRIRKSKYARSDIGYTYKQAKEKLEENRPVLFTGSPCQIAGLRNFLGKEYDNLICAEIICHGTPPMAYLKQHIKAKVGEADTYSFRGGTDDMRMQFIRGEKVIYKKERWKDEYFFAFDKNISLCESCYSCPFARLERTADITMGDFWKLDRDTLHTPMDGRISLVLVNTNQGEQVWNDISSDLVYEERTIDEALPGNPNLSRPTEQSSSRRFFLEEYRKTGDFDKAFYDSLIERAYIKTQIKHTRAWEAINKIKHFIKP